MKFSKAHESAKITKCDIIIVLATDGIFCAELFYYRTQVRFCFSAVCNFLFFGLFVPQISREPLNGFAPNSQEDVSGPTLG